MSTTPDPMRRRAFLRLAMAAGVAAPLGASLASCATSGDSTATQTSSSSAASTDDAKNPFGMADATTVDAVFFDGGYGTSYAEAAAAAFAAAHPGSTVKINATTQITQQMQPRFVGGNPPDLLDNSGANAIGLSTIAAQLDDLQDVIAAQNLEGTTIEDTIYPGILSDGMLDGKLVAINYVLTVYATWYSASLFQANGWKPPTTWDEALALGEAAKAKGKYLFCWGKEAANYYLTLAIDSAIKQGGDDVRIALGNLEADSWSHPAVQGVLTAMGKAVQAGYFRPGGAGTQFTAAQAQWSQAQEALLYPSGSWIENEMKEQTAAGFQMTGAPAPVVDSSSAMPVTALHATGGEPFVVPTAAKSAAGGKELLRVMLSKETAAAFAKSTLASTIVKNTIPADAFGSSALASQVAMLEAAGSDTFSYNFPDLYGWGSQTNVLFNGFLSGQISVADLTSGLQKLADDTRNDASVTKVTVS